MDTTDTKKNLLNKFTPAQFLNFALGFFGLQFAWQVRVILSGPVVEELGASPFLYGLIWLAGPLTGVLLQPIVGAMSDRTKTIIGKRSPYLLIGSFVAGIAMFVFPYSGIIAQNLQKILGGSLPIYTGLLIAAFLVWIIDASINIIQGPYRALIPDNMSLEQYSIANSYISLSIGLGSVVAAGAVPFLKHFFNYQVSTEVQFFFGGAAFFLSILWTVITLKEGKKQSQREQKRGAKLYQDTEQPCFLTRVMEFFEMSPEVLKICAMHFLSWVGAMCLVIFFTQYSVHTIYGVPDLSLVSEEVKKSYEQANLSGVNFSSLCFAIFNFICFLFALPIGWLASKFGNKKIHLFSLVSMALAFLGLAFFKQEGLILFLMAVAGIGWASILSLPFAMLSRYILIGTEGSAMGIFNVFIAGPQVFVSIFVALFISKCYYKVPCGINYHWEYTFLIGAVCLLIAAFITKRIKERV